MNDDDYKLTPCGQLGCKIAVSTHKFIGEFPDEQSALSHIAELMEADQYWPDIYWISDHGNVSLMDKNGNFVNP